MEQLVASLPGDDLRRESVQQLLAECARVRTIFLVTKAESKVWTILAKQLQKRPPGQPKLKSQLVRVCSDCTKATCSHPQTWESKIWQPLCALVNEVTQACSYTHLFSVCLFTYVVQYACVCEAPPAEEVLLAADAEAAPHAGDMPPPMRAAGSRTPSAGLLSPGAPSAGLLAPGAPSTPVASFLSESQALTLFVFFKRNACVRRRRDSLTMWKLCLVSGNASSNNCNQSANVCFNECVNRCDRMREQMHDAMRE